MVTLQLRHTQGLVTDSFDVTSLWELLNLACQHGKFSSCFNGETLRQSIRIVHNNAMLEDIANDVPLQNNDTIEFLHIFAGG